MPLWIEGLTLLFFIVGMGALLHLVYRSYRRESLRQNDDPGFYTKFRAHQQEIQKHFERVRETREVFQAPPRGHEELLEAYAEGQRQLRATLQAFNQSQEEEPPRRGPVGDFPRVTIGGSEHLWRVRQAWDALSPLNNPMTTNTGLFELHQSEETILADLGKAEPEPSPVDPPNRFARILKDDD